MEVELKFGNVEMFYNYVKCLNVKLSVDKQKILKNLIFMLFVKATYWRLTTVARKLL